MNGKPCVVRGIRLRVEEMGDLGWLWADLQEDVSPCSSVSKDHLWMIGNLSDPTSVWRNITSMTCCLFVVFSPLLPGLHPLWQHSAIAAQQTAIGIFRALYVLLRDRDPAGQVGRKPCPCSGPSVLLSSRILPGTQHMGKPHVQGSSGSYCCSSLPQSIVMLCLWSYFHSNFL